MMTAKHGGNPFFLDIDLDFSANLNPLGMPESVKKAVIASADSWEKYPDPYCVKLRKKLSEHEKIPFDRIVCGNGADDLIFRIVSALRPKKAVICAPTFGEYGKALRENGCEVTEHFLSEKNGFALTEDFLCELDHGIDMAFICSPNNPDGRTVSTDLLRKIAERCLDEDIFLICDECFLDFTVDGENLTAKQFLNEKVIILKAFTKLYAMAGLRLGYALFGDASAAERVAGTGQYWSVSTPAQTAGEAALEEKNYIERTVKYIASERRYLTEKLSECGVRVYDSEANFLLVRCGLPLYDLLLREKLLIRSCADYSGLGSDYFRIAVRTHDENERLVSAVRRVTIG